MEIYYFGSAFTGQIAKLMIAVLDINPVISDIGLPGELEIAVSKNCNLILNYSDRSYQVELKNKYRNLFDDGIICGAYEMKAYEVICIRKA